MLVFVSRCRFCFPLHNHRQSPPWHGVTARGLLSFAQPTIPPRTISWGTRATGKGPPNPGLAQALLEVLHAAKHGRCCQLSGELSERTAALRNATPSPRPPALSQHSEFSSPLVAYFCISRLPNLCSHHKRSVIKRQLKKGFSSIHYQLFCSRISLPRCC